MGRRKIITSYMGDSEYSVGIEGKTYPYIIVSNLHDGRIRGYIINNADDEGNYAGVDSKVRTTPMPCTNDKRKAIQVAKKWIKENWSELLEE